MASNAKVTTDHEEIRRWVEERGGSPATVRRTGSGEEPGILRIDFPGYSGEGSLEHISWDEWFRKFDENNLAFLHQEETSGGQRSNFTKIIAQETAQARARGIKTSRHHPARGKAISRASGSRSRTATAKRRSSASRAKSAASSARNKRSGRTGAVGKKVSARSQSRRSGRKAA